jgi:hypothetical protein
MKSLKFRLQYCVFLLLMLIARLSAFAQITPSQDAYINTATAATNYGTAATLGVVSSASSIQTTYIKFDLSSVPAGYTSANVAKATLKLYVNSVTNAGSFNVDFVNGSWTEKTITADLLPVLGTTIKGSVPLTTANANTYLMIDLTTTVGEWLSGTANDGIALVPNSPLSATFQSKENTSQSHPAELDVVFTNGATLKGVTTAAGSGLTGGGTSGTLNLSLTKSCTTNQVLQWNGSFWVCAAMSTGSGTGTITGVNAGTGLTGGGTTGSVTLNLDTTKVPLLGAANIFTGNQTVNGVVAATSFSGDGTKLTNVNAAQLGGQPASVYATQGGFNDFMHSQAFLGNGLFMYTGDPGCGSGFAGIGFGQLSGCNNYALVGSLKDTFLNRPAGGSIHLRENNADEMTLFPGGLVTIPGSLNVGPLGATSAMITARAPSGQAVWGESFGTTWSNGAGPDGVHGITHNKQGVGVSGTNTDQDGIGVWGSDPKGYGFVTDSNVQQGRSMGGWVKAMVYVDSTGNLIRCFNSQLAGSAASTAPCGITITAPWGPYGNNQPVIVDFGFEIDDRFVPVTFSFNNGHQGARSDDFGTTNTQVYVYDNNASPSPFYVLVY